MRALLGVVVALMLVAGSPLLADAGAAEDTMITTKVKTKLTTDPVSYTHLTLPTIYSV